MLAIELDRPRRTGYPACAGYDERSWWPRWEFHSRINVERDVEIRRGVRERAGRGVIHAGRGDLRNRTLRDAAGRLQHDAPLSQSHGLAQISNIHIVQQHHVGETGVEHLAQLHKRIDLDLDFDQMPGMGPRAL